jgi:hypothetical protein
MKIVCLFLSLLFSFNLFAKETKILYLKGSVKLFDKDKKEQIAKIGTVVQPYSTIVTGENSLVILKIEGHSTHRISANSKVMLERTAKYFEGGRDIEESSSLVIEVGNILSDVLDKSDVVTHEVKTTSTTMGIRGTKLQASLEDDNLWVTVKTGEVEVYNEASQEREIVLPEESLVVEADKKFSFKKKMAWINDLNWNASNKKSQIRFKELRAKRREALKKNRRSWKQNKLFVNKKLQEYSKKRQKWKARVKKNNPKIDLERLNKRDSFKRPGRLQRRQRLRQAIQEPLPGTIDSETKQRIRRKIIKRRQGTLDPTGVND